MKKILFIPLTIAFVATIRLAYGQSTDPSSIMLANELLRNEVGQLEPIYCNPLLLDGKPLDYQTFNLGSTGQLSLVSGDPNASTKDLIPFYVQLRRNGSILPIAALNFLNRSLHEMDISEVLVYARHGDDLIITPTYQRHWKAKRIIKLIEPEC